MSGRTGFGLGSVDLATRSENISDLQLLAQAGDHTALLQLMVQYLKSLSDRYAEPQLLQPVQISLSGAAGQTTQRIDYSNQAHNSVLVCVNNGTLNLFAGDYSGMSQTANPNLGAYSAGTNQQLFLPLQGRVYTVINPSTTVTLTAVLIPIAL